MKLTTFGATGGSGRQLTEQALAERYVVTAFVRHPTKLTIPHEHLTIVKGELDDIGNIERAVDSADVVTSLFGPKLGGD
jgi:Putative NADH-flavin reductase